MRPLAPHGKGSLSCPSQTSPCRFVVLLFCAFRIHSLSRQALPTLVIKQRSLPVSRAIHHFLLDNCAE
jgi:hypothetical protein